MGNMLILNDDLRVQIQSHAVDCLPLEGCGLLAGKSKTAFSFLPVTNELQSPTAFRMDPQEQLNALLWMESQGLDLIAVFHSHPNGPSEPSLTDIADSFDPGVAAIIWAPSSLRAFRIENGVFTEITLASQEPSNG